MPDLFRHSNAFEPILLENMTAVLFGAELPEEGMSVVCRAMMALPEYYKDFGALTAATWDTDNEDVNLEVGELELAQYRMRLLDDMQCRLKNPAAREYWRTSKAKWYLPQFPTSDDDSWLKNYLWKASEFFVYKDTTPRFDFYSTLASTTSRVLFSGWKFKLHKLPAPARGKIEIWVNDWPSSK